MTQITIRNVPPELHQKLKRLAEKDRRSLNNYILTILEQYISRMEQDDAEGATPDRGIQATQPK